MKFHFFTNGSYKVKTLIRFRFYATCFVTVTIPHESELIFGKKMRYNISCDIQSYKITQVNILICDSIDQNFTQWGWKNGCWW